MLLGLLIFLAGCFGGAHKCIGGTHSSPKSAPLFVSGGSSPAGLSGAPGAVVHDKSAPGAVRHDDPLKGDAAQKGLNSGVIEVRAALGCEKLTAPRLALLRPAAFL